MARKAKSGGKMQGGGKNAIPNGGHKNTAAHEYRSNVTGKKKK